VPPKIPSPSAEQFDALAPAPASAVSAARDPSAGGREPFKFIIRIFLLLNEDIIKNYYELTAFFIVLTKQ
jgi:hypothetical protein